MRIKHKLKLFSMLSLLCMGLSQTMSATAASCRTGDWDFAQPAAGWTALSLSSLKRDTQYTVSSEQGKGVLTAVADNSASLFAALAKPKHVAPQYISWRWKTDALIVGADNRDKNKEDAPLRIIVAFDGDRSKLPDAEKKNNKWAKRISGREPPYATLMYIWSEQVAVDTIIPSAHSGQVKMLVASSGSAGLGQWQNMRRNLLADYRRAFGAEPGALLGIGVLTDTDNTDGKASGQYADIQLECSAE